MKNMILVLAFLLAGQFGYAMPKEFEAWLADSSFKQEQLKVLCDLDFEQTTFETLQPKWIVYKGEYEVTEGHLLGRELEEDHHVATSGMNLKIGHHGLAYFELELHKAKNVIVTLNGKGRGHVCRAVISPSFIRVQSDNKDKPVNVTKKYKLKPDQKVKVVLELKGDQLSMTLLGSQPSEALTLKNGFIDHPIDNLRWAVAKGPAKIDNICVLGAGK